MDLRLAVLVFPCVFVVILAALVNGRCRGGCLECFLTIAQESWQRCLMEGIGCLIRKRNLLSLLAERTDCGHDGKFPSPAFSLTARRTSKSESEINTLRRG